MSPTTLRTTLTVSPTPMATLRLSLTASPTPMATLRLSLTASPTPRLSLTARVMPGSGSGRCSGSWWPSKSQSRKETAWSSATSTVSVSAWVSVSVSALGSERTW